MMFMPMLGPVELLIVLLVVVPVAGGVIAIALARKGNRSSVPSLGPATPPDLHRIVTRLTLQRQPVQAIKELRQHTGLDLLTAKTVVDAVALGHDMWSHPAMARFRPADSPALSRANGPDLASRVRELVAAHRDEQAVYLVRGETGMGSQEAQAFVDSIRSTDGPTPVDGA